MKRERESGSGGGGDGGEEGRKGEMEYGRPTTSISPAGWHGDTHDCPPHSGRRLYLDSARSVPAPGSRAARAHTATDQPPSPVCRSSLFLMPQADDRTRPTSFLNPRCVPPCSRRMPSPPFRRPHRLGRIASALDPAICHRAGVPHSRDRHQSATPSAVDQVPDSPSWKPIVSHKNTYTRITTINPTFLGPACPRQALPCPFHHRRPCPSLAFVTICHHGLDPMHICAEAPELHLLALRRFDRQRVRIHPLVRGHVGRLFRVREDIEHGRLIDHRQERHRRHDLFQDITNLGLNFALRLRRRAVKGRVLNKVLNVLWPEDTYGWEPSAGGSTRLMSNTQRSSGVRVSFEMMARTSCVIAPVRSHSVGWLIGIRPGWARTVTIHLRFTCFRILRYRVMVLRLSPGYR